MDFRVLSIGTLAMHPLRDERTPRRTGHATTTLVRAGDAVIIVDPGLPGTILAQRLDERAGIAPRAITHVMLTSFSADTCRGIAAFPDAEWLISQPEREAVGVPLATAAREIARATDDPESDEPESDEHQHPGSDEPDASHPSTHHQGRPIDRARRELELQLGILHRCRPAPDRIAPGVDLFPLHGVTPGLTGLLLAEPARTTLICGDAIPTIEHMERGQVPQHAADVAAARQSMAEALEIADLLILGRDNLAPNPARPSY